MGDQDAQRGEDRRGGSDRRMLRRLDDGVHRVAQPAPDHDAEPAHPDAQRLGREDPEHRAEQEIGQQVRRVEMQGQGGQDAPPLALGENVAVHASGPQPVHPVQ